MDWAFDTLLGFLLILYVFRVKIFRWKSSNRVFRIYHHIGRWLRLVILIYVVAMVPVLSGVEYYFWTLGHAQFWMVSFGLLPLILGFVLLDGYRNAWQHEPEKFSAFWRSVE